MQRCCYTLPSQTLLRHAICAHESLTSPCLPDGRCAELEVISLTLCDAQTHARFAYPTDQVSLFSALRAVSL